MIKSLIGGPSVKHGVGVESTAGSGVTGDASVSVGPGIGVSAGA